MGKHFGENAEARDKLFTTLGAMGREMVKECSLYLMEISMKENGRMEKNYGQGT